MDRCKLGKDPLCLLITRGGRGGTLLFRDFDINTCIFFPFVIVSIKMENGSIFLAFGFSLFFFKRDTYTILNFLTNLQFL